MLKNLTGFGFWNLVILHKDLWLFFLLLVCVLRAPSGLKEPANELVNLCDLCFSIKMVSRNKKEKKK